MATEKRAALSSEKRAALSSGETEVLSKMKTRSAEAMTKIKQNIGAGASHKTLETTLRANVDDAMKHCNVGFADQAFNCFAASGSDIYAVRDELVEQDLRFLRLATFALDSDAVGELYAPGELLTGSLVIEEVRPTLRDQVERLRKEAVPIVLAGAKSANAPGGVLFAAARILNRGEAAPRDTEAALRYGVRAWRLGYIAAAGEVAGIYHAADRRKNAYLWSVRCVAPCKRDTSVELRFLEIGLSVEERAKLELAAADPTYE